MMTIRSGYKFVFICLLAVLLPSSLAFADGATVDCSGATPGAFTTITAALASLPAAGPNSIAVTGTCHENVVMFGRTDLTIFGNPTATVVPGNANGHLLAIDCITEGRNPEHYFRWRPRCACQRQFPSRSHKRHDPEQPGHRPYQHRFAGAHCR